MKGNYIATISFAFLFLACKNDSVVKLGDSYFFVHDSFSNNQIVGDNTIPENILMCFYDSNFIIAKQMPSKVANAIYDNEPVYKDGRDRLYFWLIIQRSKRIFGPLNKIEFDSIRLVNDVPDESKLKKIVIDSSYYY